MYPGCVRDVSRVCPGCVQGVSEVYPRYVQGVSRLYHSSQGPVTRELALNWFKLGLAGLGAAPSEFPVSSSPTAAAHVGIGSSSCCLPFPLSWLRPVLSSPSCPAPFPAAGVAGMCHPGIPAVSRVEPPGQGRAGGSLGAPEAQPLELCVLVWVQPGVSMENWDAGVWL